MKLVRSIVTAGLACLAAASCGSDKATGPGAGAVAAVSVAATTSTSVTIGSSVTFVATALNASGGTVSGQTFTWTSSNPLVATVTSGGVVTGVAAGVASIAAAAGTVTGQTAVSVSASTAQLSCASVTPLALDVGDVHQLTGLERSSLCISGGAGTEYVLVAFNASLDTSTAASAVALASTGTAPAANLPSPQVISSGPLLSLRGVPRDIGFEQRMRATERRELDPKFAAAKAWYASRSRSIAPPGGISAITGVPSSPAVGSIITLNANATSACSSPQPHGATVMAVSAHAIVAVDTLAPANGFSALDYQNFAAAFDTLIFPLDTLNYGTPSDIDGNGRELLFFTQAVNQLTAPDASSYVGGFFFSRDLFPLVATPTLAACAGSNVGEMFYLPVADPTAIYNGFFLDKVKLVSQLRTTIVHEFQHLINAGRHLYINTGATRLEESWLDESQAMLAQELLYYHVSGFGPGQKLTYATISSGSNLNGTQLGLVNAYLVQGLGVLNYYVQVPESSTPYNNTENLATLGAGWEFMRYLLDHTTGTQSSLSRAIDNGTVSGFANVQHVFGLSASALAATYQSWAIAQYVDGTGLTANPAYANPSWTFRDVIPKVFSLGVFPLMTRSLLPATPVSITLRGGAASYIRFRVNAGLTGQIMPANNGAIGTNVMFALVRTY